MSRLKLKFPYQEQAIPQVDIALLVVGLFLLVITILHYRHVTEEINYWTTRVERLEKQQQQKLRRVLARHRVCGNSAKKSVKK